jgi:cytochrome c551/c552
MKFYLAVGVICLHVLAFTSLALAADQVDGEAIYMKNCKMCHNLNKAGMGSSLETMADKYQDNSSGIVDFLNNPTGKAANMMKRFITGLSQPEKEAVATWMLTQNKGEASPE